jgi:hypothetical protein
MELARLAPQIEPELACLIEDWDKLTPAGKVSTRIEDICRARQIDAMHFFSVVNEAAMKFRDNASLMIASINMPGLVQKSVEYGMEREGFKDRQAIFQHSGFVPTPQGTRINILNQNSAKAAAQAEATVDRGLPSFEASITELDEE